MPGGGARQSRIFQDIQPVCGGTAQLNKWRLGFWGRATEARGRSGQARRVRVNMASTPGDGPLASHADTVFRRWPFVDDNHVIVVGIKSIIVVHLHLLWFSHLGPWREARTLDVQGEHTEAWSTQVPQTSLRTKPKHWPSWANLRKFWAFLPFSR